MEIENKGNDVDGDNIGYNNVQVQDSLDLNSGLSYDSGRGAYFSNVSKLLFLFYLYIILSTIIKRDWNKKLNEI